mgnify:CR=1 FL=1
MSKKSRPTDADRASVVAVADLAASWCGNTYVALAVATLRGFIAGSRNRNDLDNAILEMVGRFGPYGFIAEHVRSAPQWVSVKNARDAVLQAHSLCVADPMDNRAWLKLERALIANVENSGRVLGLSDAPDQTLSAWKNATTNSAIVRGTMPVTHTNDHARLVLRGQLVRRMRDRRKLSPEELVTRLRELGGELSVAQLTRVENGTASPATARGERLAEGLGCVPAWCDDVEAQAWTFAEKFAALSVKVSGDRWFSDVVARDGEDVARSITLLALVTALRNS